jgi:hypothetical protein
MILTVALALFTGGYLIFSSFRFMGADLLEWLQTFSTIFISILMQAIPFMMIGVLVSSAMHVFVPDEWVVRIFPTRHGLGFLTAMFAGLFFPVCECAIVPVVIGLVRKGVALPIAVTFMLSAPIINPIVIVSTLYAFPGNPEITLMRVCFRTRHCLLTERSCISLQRERSELQGKGEKTGMRVRRCGLHGHRHGGHGRGTPGKLKELFLHAGNEMFT